MKYLFWTFLLILSMPYSSYSQDEWVVRDLLKPEFEKTDLAPISKLDSQTDIYKLDLEGDNKEEGIVFSREEGLYYVNLHRIGEDAPFYKFNLESFGSDAHVYRIRKVSLSNDVKLLLFYHFQGGVESSKGYRASARLYFLPLEKGNREYKVFAGPLIWVEKKSFNDTYYRRKYEVSFKDLDEDLQKEVIVSQQSVVKVYRYQGAGNWIVK